MSQERRIVLTAADVQAQPVGSELWVPFDATVTPLAQEEAIRRQIQIRVGQAQRVASAEARQIVAIGADHGGFALKEQLKNYLGELGFSVNDLGCHNTESVDYPDYAYAVAKLVADGRATAGVMVDGAGIGSAMVANKIPGVRAALCYDLSTAMNSREHNHANVLTLGAGLIGPNLAKQIVKTWLETPWGGQRHAQRVAKIEQIERRFLKNTITER